MNTLLILAASAALFMLMSTLAVYSFGRFARQARGAKSFALPVRDGETQLDVMTSGLGAGDGGQHGLMLLADNMRAFALRVDLARNAGRGLDLQYYYWKDDLTGGLLAREIVRAADRGVRVRLLLDDINMRDDRDHLALDRHPNIEIRLFNPSRNRAAGLRRGFELLLRIFSSTRRMHNKMWIADGRAAIIGGRNIGDAYFDASDAANFRDMDLLLVGPCVTQAENIFDDFWNSAAVLPIRSLADRRVGDLDRFREKMERMMQGPSTKPYLQEIVEEHGRRPIGFGSSAFHWTGEAQVISDPPQKADGGRRANWLVEAIFPMIMEADRAVGIIAPYFIPGVTGVRRMADLVARGTEVTVLTNSLAATDVAAVHGAYAPYRKPLLEAGVRLYELKPEFPRQKLTLFGSRAASLHTKAFMIDGESGFVGSFNFDPRSFSLNTEMGVLFTHPALVEEMNVEFRAQLGSESSYHVVLDKGKVRWEDGAAPNLLYKEPQANWGRWLVATIIGWLPLESQL
ncbi:phospholipase D family protein [Aquamicrobium sp. LC103]|uniref:phospholipase D family protein n=1 Tax=Aquamicrobium sp. LC103 TaxID=1120658 RepID=UPI0009E5D8CB|nr:phospholipase D family protein [Aquamicrobium sp. LC103]TKT69712.1 phospholipase D family protein [Aquamicrobium sp. LC103]